MSTTTQQHRQQSVQETYDSLVAMLLDRARGYEGDDVDVYQTVADDFIRSRVGDDRTMLTFILHRSHHGPHRTYPQHSFDTGGDGMGAMKALAASALVADMLRNG